MFFGLLLLEVALRAFDLHVHLNKVWRWHATLGWTQDHSQTFEYEFDGSPVRGTFNSLGFRDVEHEWTKPAGTRRIVVLGDSFCEAIQVNLDQTFFGRLETMLDARQEGDWEVINLGVGDWGQGQQLIALRDIGLRFAPDIVVCQVFPLNDIGNNGIDLYGLCKSHNDIYRPYFVERDGELVEARPHPLLHQLRRVSRVFQNVELAYYGLAWSWQSGDDSEKWRARAREAGFQGLSPLLHTFVPDAEQPPAVQRSWRVTELLLERMAGMCREHDIAFVSVVIAWEGRLSDVWPRFARNHVPSVMDPDYPERRLGALFERLKVPAVLMKPIFEADLARFHPTRESHLGPGGHEMVAEALLETLVENGLLAR